MESKEKKGSPSATIKEVTEGKERARADKYTFICHVSHTPTLFDLHLTQQIFDLRLALVL